MAERDDPRQVALTDDLEPETKPNQDVPEQYLIIIECRTEQEQAQLLNRLLEEEVSCRALIS